MAGSTGGEPRPSSIAIVNRLFFFSAADAEAYTTQLVRFMAELDSAQKAETWSARIREFAKAGGAQLTEAKRLYREHAETLNPRQRVAILVELSAGGLRQDGDPERFRAGFEAIRELRAPATD